MAVQKKSRRDFLKGVGAGIAVMNLPSNSNWAEAAEIHSGKDFYIAKIDHTLFARIKGKSYKDDCTLPLDR